MNSLDTINWVAVIKLAIPFLLGGSVGGLIGFRIGVSKSIKQSQKAGDNATQFQIGNIRNG